MTPHSRIIESDSREAILDIPDESVRLIVTSPPYNIGKSYEKSDRMSASEYEELIADLVKLCRAKLTDDGSICWQVGNQVKDKVVFPLDYMAYNIFNTLGFKLRNRIVWKFNFGLNSTRRFSGRYETILWFTKGDQYYFNLDPVRVPQLYPGKRHAKTKGDKAGSLVKVIDKEGNTIDAEAITKTEHAQILLPKEYNSVGLIDGQHRVFSYHMGGKNDQTIAGLRKRLNLLVTGVIYPGNLSDADRMKFEAEIFLEINSNQTGAKSDLKQAISSIITPFEATSIAKRVLTKMNRSGALKDVFVKYFYDKERLKTTSVISYGLRHLVVLSENGPLFKNWQRVDKEALLSAPRDAAVVDEYVDFCQAAVNEWFFEVRRVLGADRFTIKQKDGKGILNTTTVIGFMNYYRFLLERGMPMGKEEYGNALLNTPKVDFSKYKSSQYGALAREMLEKAPVDYK